MVERPAHVGPVLVEPGGARLARTGLHFPAFDGLSPGRLALLLNLPTLVIVGLVVGYPLLFSLFLSLHSVSIDELRSGAMPFVGLANVQQLLADPVFQLSLGNTLLFSLATVPTLLVLSLFVAVAMNYARNPLARATRLLILLPWAVPPIANGLMWSFIYNPSYGYLEAIRAQTHWLPGFTGMLSTPATALLAIVIAHVWRSVPLGAILFYAGLQSIDEEIYEAAEIDGSTGWHQFWTITLPLLKPVVLVVLLLRTIWSVLVFDEVFAITNGGPGNSTWVGVFYVYVTSFRYFSFGLGAAASYVLTGIIMVAAVLYIRFLYRRSSVAAGVA